MTTRVGIVGSGYISRGLTAAILASQDMDISCVLTRTACEGRADFPHNELLTSSLDRLIENSDVVVECSGSVIHATAVVDAALAAGLPVVTMDAEMQVTTGSYFVGKGVFTEAEGDQPGCLAALSEDVVAMGFRPLVYGNVKGFLNLEPPQKDMNYWAERQGISLDKCIAFTDGTKVQVEQALVANGLGAGIAADRLLGLRDDDLAHGAQTLAVAASQNGHPLSDFIVCPKAPPGVFIVGCHQTEQQQYLRNFKLGDGPYYMLLRNYHLCHLEVGKTVRRVMQGNAELLNNSANPSIGVAAITKRPLESGHVIERGIGSFDTRGVAVRIVQNPNHVPIGLLDGAVTKRRIEHGEMLTWSDVDVPDSIALDAWASISSRVV